MRAGNATVFSNGIADRLDKSSRVIVYGIVGSVADENAPGDGTDCEYYFVAASVGGETVYGFIPTSYVLNYDSSVDWSDSDSLVVWATDHGVHTDWDGHGNHGEFREEDINVMHFYGAYPKR